MIDRVLKTRLIVAGILAIGFIITAVVLHQQSQALGSIPAKYNSDLGEDGAEGSTSWLRLENNNAFKDAFPDALQTPILNNIYGKYYDSTGTIARFAVLDGRVSSKNKEGIQTFTLLMGEDKKPITVQVHVKNDATNDFEVTIKEVK